MCAVDLVCCPGLPESHVKSYVVHYEGDGFPHCLAVRIHGQGTNATVIDGATVYKMSTAVLCDLHYAAVDRSTMVSYWKRNLNDKLGDKSALLLEMVAGADSETSEEYVEEDERRGYGKFTHEEADCPAMSDDIIHSLHKETCAVIEKLADKAPNGWKKAMPYVSVSLLHSTPLAADSCLETSHREDSVRVFRYETGQSGSVTVRLYDHAASSQSNPRSIFSKRVCAAPSSIL